MPKTIDPPASPSQSSQKGIARLTALLEDPGNQNQWKRPPRNTAIPRSGTKNDMYPNLERKQSLISKPRITQNELSNKESNSESDESSVYEETSFHNALEKSESCDEITPENDCYEDLTISTDSTPGELSTQEIAFQQYKAQLTGRSKVNNERDDVESKDDLNQFEKDMEELDLKLSTATDSDNSEDDLEMQPPYDPETYQKLLGPMDTRTINWNKSVFFLPCLLVFIIVIIVTPMVRKTRREGNLDQALSLDPTIPSPTSSPSWIDPSTEAPSQWSPPTARPTRIPGSSLSPTLEDPATDQCSAEFPTSGESSSDLIVFLPPFSNFDDCTTPPEKLPTLQRLNCFGTKSEYRPEGFVPNRFRESKLKA